MAQGLKTLLKNRLAGARKVVVVGVGSDLRADDVAGLLVVERLQHFLRGKKSCRLRVVFGDTAPENMTGPIRRHQPSHVVIVDSAEMQKKAGAITLIDPEKIKGVSFSTHQLPLSIMVRYLGQELACEVLVIGIQPNSVAFGGPVSGCVKRSAGRLAQILKTCI
jgi:hydrogenase 3 maturation protease